MFRLYNVDNNTICDQNSINLKLEYHYIYAYYHVVGIGMWVLL